MTGAAVLKKTMVSWESIPDKAEKQQTLGVTAGCSDNIPVGADTPDGDMYLVALAGMD